MGRVARGTAGIVCPRSEGGLQVQVLGSRRGGIVTLVIAAVALVAAGAFAAWQLMQRPTVDAPTPAPGSAVADPRPAIAFSVEEGERLGDLQVTLDGRDVTSRMRGAGDELSVTPVAKLPDGPHEVAVSFSSGNVFARSVTRRWSFDVDTVAPRLAVRAPKQGALRARRAVKFQGRAEAGSTVTVAYKGGEATAQAGGDGAWSAVARLPEGDVATTVTALDRAGNSTARPRGVTVDTTAPRLEVTAPAKGDQLTETDQPLVYGAITADDPRALTFTASVNGKTVATAKGRDATSADEAEDVYAEAAAGGPATLELDGRRFAMPVGTLPQGRNRIRVTVVDRAGNRARAERVVHVNSTEEFGAVEIGARARGADVTTLQQRLREAGVYPKKGKLSGVVDKKTEKAIARYQKRYKLRKTGIADERMIQRMVGRLVANLSQYRVRLIRNGKVVVSYPIAKGQAAYPTPTGDYEIIDKQVDPTWTPPDSPWAAELSSIPPGPGNPLGTRWIGTSAPAIGFHGTYARYSVGTAASHGCMRMYIEDVEALYEEVTIGMKVSIVA
jgi:lipoprotein-anchoring transpeptidase ErfK/SrfK